MFESLERYLERVAVALETIANNISGRKPITEEQIAEALAPASTFSGMPEFAPEVAGLSKKGRPKKEKEPQPETTAPAASNAAPVTALQVGEAVRKLVTQDANGGHAKAKSVLETFGASRLSEIKEADFPAVIKKINDLLAAVKK